MSLSAQPTDKAFPHSLDPNWDSGMELRDWFAGQILCGMAGSSYWAENFSMPDGEGKVKARWIKPVVEAAFLAADEAMKERSKRGN